MPTRNKTLNQVDPQNFKEIHIYRYDGQVWFEFDLAEEGGDPARISLADTSLTAAQRTALRNALATVMSDAASRDGYV